MIQIYTIYSSDCFMCKFVSVARYLYTTSSLKCFQVPLTVILYLMLDVLPFHFGIQLAALASKKEIMDLENWLGSHLAWFQWRRTHRGWTQLALCRVQEHPWHANISQKMVVMILMGCGGCPCI